MGTWTYYAVTWCDPEEAEKDPDFAIEYASVTKRFSDRDEAFSRARELVATGQDWYGVVKVEHMEQRGPRFDSPLNEYQSLGCWEATDDGVHQIAA